MKAEAATYAGMAFALTVLVACAGAPESPGPVDAAMGVGVTRDPAARSAPIAGFLTPEMTPDATAIIPPAPQVSEARNDADWKIFRDTRAIQTVNPDRWALARTSTAVTFAVTSPAIQTETSPAAPAPITIRSRSNRAGRAQRA